MSEKKPGTVELIGREIGQMFRPLYERIDRGEIILLLAELGLALPEDLANNAAFTTAITDLSTDLQKLPLQVSKVLKAIEDEDYVEAASVAAEMIQSIKNIVDNVNAVGTEITNFYNANSGLFNGLDAGDLATFITDLAEAIIDYAVIEYLQLNAPEMAAILEFFGIIEETINNPGSNNPFLPEHTRRELHLDRIVTLFTNPVQLLADLYGWGGNLTNGGADILQKLEKVLAGLGWPALYSNDGGPELDLLVAKVEPRPSVNPTGLALTIEQMINGNLKQTINGSNWKIDLCLEAGVEAGAALVVQPTGIDLEVNDPTFSGEASFRYTMGQEAPEPAMVILGSANGSRLQAQQIAALLGTEFTYIPTQNKASGSVKVEAEIKGGKLVIKPSNPDGFLAKILPEDGITADFDVLVGVDSDRGLYFNGSGTLTINIPTNLSIGNVLEIQGLNVGIGTADGKLALSAGANLKTELGPFTAVVEDMGVKFVLDFPSNRKGNLGPIDLGIDFKPPKGIGMSLDTSTVKGGGYLLFDPDNHKYAGAIELMVVNAFSLSAIGILNTRFPDGSKGYSLLILVNVQFGSPIALGMNFYLAGVGGMIGLHRTVNVDRLRSGIKDGTLESIMFPTDVIANITKIISDLSEVFPAKKDQFLLGFMARITWNVPAILTVDLGLVVEFPSPVRFAIMGVLKTRLPTEENPLIKLNVGFLGVIDFDLGLLSFDASIYDSKIVTISIEGDMALRISWGAKKDFLLSMGGFHPSYSPPSHLNVPALNRLKVTVWSGNPSLILTAYFAITSNTVQFGAEINFKFKVWKVKVLGWFGFDALFQFSPFMFSVGIRAGVAVKWGSKTLFEISLSFNLSGPTPWHAKGYGKFKILFISVKVKFDTTFGEKKEINLPNIAVLPEVLEAFRKKDNWRVQLPEGRNELVSRRELESGPGTLIIAPGGTVIVEQNLIPLNLTFDKYGNFLPSDINQISISKAYIGNVDPADEVSTSDEYGDFAPDTYKTMEDKDKLKAPSYQEEVSGTRLTGVESMKADYGITRPVNYEVRLSDVDPIEDEPINIEALPTIEMPTALFNPFISGGAIGQSALSVAAKNRKANASSKISLDQEQYVVINHATGGIVHDAAVGQKLTRSAADEFIKGARRSGLDTSQFSLAPKAQVDFN